MLNYNEGSVVMGRLQNSASALSIGADKPVDFPVFHSLNSLKN